MTGDGINALENKGPRHMGRQAQDLGVEQVTQANEAAGQSGGHTDPVQEPEIRLVRMPPRIEIKSEEHTQSSAVAGQAALPDHRNLERMREVIVRFVKE